VTILAVLQLLSALALLAGGATMALLSTETGFFGIIFVIAGGILLIFGLIELVIFYGLWTGKKWARFLAIIFSVLGLLFNLLGLVGGSIISLVGLILAFLILYYLYQPQVKAYFA
jgi:uncharacterized membrane protein (DUF2068 family)